ncbi:MAG: hypothetical protein P1U81_06605 [Verrucomicrobiales bacterium]|jgi:hypothetical protein|nr:hypothetical protein [Verrucomicrobiales bacterium]
MQQTSFDRWLQRKFVHQTRFYCNTLPRALPGSVLLEENDAEKGGRYLYRITARDEAVIQQITRSLEAENITYTSRVADRAGIAASLFSNPNRSFTMSVVWIFFGILLLVLVFSGLPGEAWQWLTSNQPSL